MDFLSLIYISIVCKNIFDHYIQSQRELISEKSNLIWIKLENYLEMKEFLNAYLLT